MPDVGLFTATEPLSPDYKVVIKYSVEVEGLTVYQESYDVDTLAKELKDDPDRVAQLWLRRALAPVHCRKRHGFSGCLTRFLADGVCADCGHENPQPSRTSSAGQPTRGGKSSGPNGLTRKSAKTQKPHA